jgi:hypothetical protein
LAKSLQTLQEAYKAITDPTRRRILKYPRGGKLGKLRRVYQSTAASGGESLSPPFD